VLTLTLWLGFAATGPVRWIVLVLAAVPAAQVHWHDRDRGLGWGEACVVGLIAGAIAYLITILGLTIGAATTFTVLVAADTGLLATLANACGIATLLVTVAGRKIAAAHDGPHQAGGGHLLVRLG